MVKVQNTINIVEETDTLEEMIDKTNPYVLYFTASWCGPCKSIYPLFEELSKRYSNIAFYKIDIDECEEFVSKFNIESVPTFYFYKKNNEYFNICKGADTVLLSNRIYSLNNSEYKISEEEIEPLINNKTNTIYYNNSESNYEETGSPVNKIEQIGDLDKFFETIDLNDTNW
jgi:thioredoxin 1|tara:strand:+ start:1089 stop:1604 length:516 start_codon:yes stop_codon:yes gene_type:complete